MYSVFMADTQILRSNYLQDRFHTNQSFINIDLAKSIEQKYLNRVLMEIR